jgi:hypothetical protein
MLSWSFAAMLQPLHCQCGCSRFIEPRHCSNSACPFANLWPISMQWRPQLCCHHCAVSVMIEVRGKRGIALALALFPVRDDFHIKYMRMPHPKRGTAQFNGLQACAFAASLHCEFCAFGLLIALLYHSEAAVSPGIAQLCL